MNGTSEVSVHSLPETINITIPLYSSHYGDDDDTDVDIACTFLNVTDGSWSSSGCKLGAISSDSITCMCTHLTTFVGMDVLTTRRRDAAIARGACSGQPQQIKDGTDPGALPLPSMIAIIVSIGGVVIIATVITILLVKKRRRGKFHVTAVKQQLAPAAEGSFY
eukprot:TRINITY_DN9432_c0_g1_i1.p1 TRINITY_DN9432_c0_g1~~TRINITY_DN9432_c0_g1_i1.p1  ORF type:complete len:164 (+),score=31.32 TRINITY_DN9432_c0_g1_i1:409-900(+)